MKSGRSSAFVELPVADLSRTELATLDAMRAKDVVVYGTKASNLGEIVAAKLPGFDVPPGFGVPFHYYAEHVKKIPIPQFSKDAATRKKQLAQLKQAIIDAPVSDELRGKVSEALAALPGAGPCAVAGSDAGAAGSNAGASRIACLSCASCFLRVAASFENCGIGIFFTCSA